MKIDIAGSRRTRLRGLVGRRAPSGRALLLTRTRSVHTVGVRAPLDLVWLDGRGELVRVDRGVRPFRVRTCRAARCVYECAEGEADALLAWLYSPALIAPATTAAHA